MPKFQKTQEPDQDGVEIDEDPSCEDTNPGPSYDELLAAHKQQQELIEYQSQLLSEKDKDLQAVQEKLEQAIFAETVEEDPDFDPDEELVNIWIPDDAKYIVKKTGFDPETGESYQYIECRITRIPKGKTNHESLLHNIPLEQTVEVPRYVYNHLNDGTVKRASIVQSNFGM